MRRYLLCGLIIWGALASPALAGGLLESTLKDGVGVRPLGMGGAFTAYASDANAIFYNPAGLGKSGFSYSQGWQDMKNKDYRLNDYFIVNYQSFGLANWQRQDLAGNKVKTTAYSFGAAEGPITWGMTYKHIIQNTSLVSGEGFSIDGGLMGSFSPQLFWGLLLQDIYKSVQTSTSIRAGLLYYLEKTSVLAMDAEMRNIRGPEGAQIYMHYGVESQVAEGLIVRAGWSRERYSYGVTAAIPYFTFDYASQVDIRANGEAATHMFAIRLKEADDIKDIL